MVILGGGRFLMSEVPLYSTFSAHRRTLRVFFFFFFVFFVIILHNDQDNA